LQFSFAQYRHGKLPNINEQLLISMCERLVGGVRGQKDKSRSSGKCEFGLFGTVIAKGYSPSHVQTWVLSNQSEVIVVTHTCEKEPDAQEVAEANGIALMTGCS
jgi:hypothetical protein